MISTERVDMKRHSYYHTYRDDSHVLALSFISSVFFFPPYLFHKITAFPRCLGLQSSEMLMVSVGQLVYTKL